MIARPAIEKTPRRMYFRATLGRLPRRRAASLRDHSINPYRPRDVFHFLVAQVRIAKRELVSYLLVHGPRDADTSRLCQALQACCDINPVAIDLLAFHHYVAEVDPNAKLHPPFRRNVGIFGSKRGLDLDRALDRIHDAGELRQHAITRRVYEPAAMLLDERIYELAVRG